MKSRIKVIELHNGTKHYNPQSKRYLIGRWANLVAFADGVGECVYKKKTFLTQKEAEVVIDRFLTEEQQRKLLSTKKVTYIKYP